MYGLKEAAILAYEQLLKHLGLYGYVHFKHTPGMWRHTTRPITFTLQWTILASNTSTKMMQTIFFSTPKQKFHYNWLVWWLIPWSNNQLKLWKWLCRHIHAWLCPKSSNKVQASPGSYSTTCSTCMDNACTWKKCNTQPLINPLCLMSTQQNKYKQYLVNFCTMHMLLIPLYCPHSMKSQPGGQTNRKINESMHTTCGLFIHTS